MLVKGKENKRKSLESGKNNNEIIRQGLGMVTHKGNVTDEKGQRRGCTDFWKKIKVYIYL